MIRRLREWADSHTVEGRWSPVAITFLIMGHVAAALKHYVFDKDNVLPGMLPLAHELEGEPI